MKIKEIKEGMKVYIPTNCTNTKSIQGWNTIMDKYQGTIQMVESIETHTIKPYVRIQGWGWDPKDLKIPLLENSNKEIEEALFFDENKVWI